MKRHLFIILVFFALAPGLAAAEEAPGANGSALRAFLARSSDPSVPRDFVANVLQEARDLEARGIPSEPYLLKANEGLAKGIAPAKITPVLGQTRRREEAAAAWVDRMGEGSPEKDASARRAAILQVQAAMLNGASVKDLEKALRSSEKRDRPSWEGIEAKARDMQPRRHVLVGSGAVQPISESPSTHRHPVKDPLGISDQTTEKASTKSKAVEKGHEKAEKPVKVQRAIPQKPVSSEKGRQGPGPAKSHGPKSSHGHGKGK